MDKVRFLTFNLAICLLASCAPSPQAIQAAIAETQEAAATSTPTYTLVPSDTPTFPPTLIPTSTSIPQSSIVNEFVKNGFEPCWKMGFGIDDGVFKDGVTYTCFYEKNYFTDVLVGYDGSLILAIPGYKAPQFNILDATIIEDVYGIEIRSWIDNGFNKLQGGKQESNINNYHLLFFIGVESMAIPGSEGTLLNAILEIVPIGKVSHLVEQPK